LIVIINYIFFILIYTALVFIFSYVYANKKKKDRVNTAFLLFLATILIWMAINRMDLSLINTNTSFVTQNIYWIILLNIAIIFLNFIYVFLNKKHDMIFYAILALNTATIIYRYSISLDYTQANFWRISELATATIMATIFTLPMIWALLLIWNTYRKTSDLKKKKQIRYLIYGLISATIISIFSEYIAPIYLPNLETHSFMYVAFLDLIVFLYLSIVKEKFLNIEMEYIYDELFMNSNEGILLISKTGNIVSMNKAFKSMFSIDNFEDNIPVKNILKDYDFETVERMYEIKVEFSNSEQYFSLIQDNINSKSSMKLLHVIDITAKKLDEISHLSNLSEKSMRDELTNLYNKRYLTENYINRDNVLEDYITMMFIDIDNFKSINDNYGHSAGDRVLKEVTQSINLSLRKDDISIRYGGDEFIVILKDTSEHDLIVIAKRILTTVKNSTYINGLVNTDITLSIGISSGRLPIVQLIKQADDAMYKSKELGKDRYSIYNNQA